MIDLRLVDGVVLHQQHVPGLQGVAAALHNIVHPARQQQDHLVKLMKVEVQLLTRRVPKVKIMIVFPEIACAADAAFFVHGASLHCSF